MHISRIRQMWITVVLIGLSSGSGCGGSATSVSIPASQEEVALEQIVLLFRSYKKAQKPPPKDLKEFLPMERGYPAAIDSLKKKQVIVCWGANLSDAPDASSTVLAYQKDVPEKGGEVLMQDGKTKTMTVDEFKAASKAGK